MRFSCFVAGILALSVLPGGGPNQASAVLLNQNLDAFIINNQLLAQVSDAASDSAAKMADDADRKRREDDERARKDEEAKREKEKAAEKKREEDEKARKDK